MNNPNSAPYQKSNRAKCYGWWCSKTFNRAADMRKHADHKHLGLYVCYLFLYIPFLRILLKLLSMHNLWLQRRSERRCRNSHQQYPVRSVHRASHVFLNQSLLTQISVLAKGLASVPAVRVLQTRAPCIIIVNCMNTPQSLKPNANHLVQLFEEGSSARSI
jgi:uncharacterized membrane protein